MQELRTGFAQGFGLYNTNGSRRYPTATRRKRELDPPPLGGEASASSAGDPPEPGAAPDHQSDDDSEPTEDAMPFPEVYINLLDLSEIDRLQAQHSVSIRHVIPTEEQRIMQPVIGRHFEFKGKKRDVNAARDAFCRLLPD